MDEGSLHPDILSDNFHDALGNPGCCNWAAGVQRQFASLGVPSPFSGGRRLRRRRMIRNVDHLAFRKAMLARDRSVWPGRGFTFPLRVVVLPLGMPSFAPICSGLHGRTGLTWSPSMSWPFQ